MTYLATFHTHLSAMRSCRALQTAGLTASMEPVPRKLSSSCGTCVRYEADSPHTNLLDRDAEAVFRIENAVYELVQEMDE